MFVPLRVHSVFSRGRGGLRVDELAAWAARGRVPGAALTDIGNIYGWAGWKRAAEAAGGVKPLFGCELELDGLTFVFLVKTAEAYPSLVELMNRRTPAGPLDGLAVIHVPAAEHPVVTDPGRPGPASGAAGRAAAPSRSAAVAPGGGEAVLAAVRERTAPGDFYLGCGFAGFERTTAAAREPGSVLSGLPIVWANPLKFVASPERLVLLRAIERKVPYPPERDRLLAGTALFGPGQEAAAMRRIGPQAAPAFKRTLEVAEKCSFSFSGGVVPGLPDGVFPRTLRQAVMERLREAGRLGWAARQRARRELQAVERSGFGAYFLIVKDIVDFARGRGILHNMRGSGASSYLAYLLGISAVDPLACDLYFERFLNPGRPEPPDIDLDFDSRRRDEVLAYVLDKYGSGGAGTGAAFVCSLKDFGARSALYETLRAFGAPPDEARSLSKRAPFYGEPECLGRSAPAAGYGEAWTLAASLQGVHHEVSLHVGGVILTPAPVERWLPLETSAKGLRMTHFDKDAVEDLRLIKLDLLSVRGLAAVSETAVKLGVRSFPPGDARVYAALAAGRTIGCFQVESPAMRGLLRRMKPRDIGELTQALALIRPGPTESGMKEALLRRRKESLVRPSGAADGERSVKERLAPGEDGCAGPVPGPAATGASAGAGGFLERILPETGGILLYEEQVMQVAERVAGMPPAEGDLLRRGLKKRQGCAPKLRERFLREAAERGYPADEVERLWLTMERFSAYSFNKAHSASYADMAYKSVYLKLRCPAVYLAAVLNAGGGYYEPAEYVAEAARNGIRVLRPDVNLSGPGFEVERLEGKERKSGEASAGAGVDAASIRTGLGSIKGLGRKLIDRLFEDRRTGGAFVSVEDLIGRVGPSRTELLSLIRAGALDRLEPSRTAQVLNYFQGVEVRGAADMGDIEKKKMLYDSLGFLPEGDPLELFEGRRPELRVKDLGRWAGSVVELVVRVVDARERMTLGRSGGAAGGPTYFYMFEDETGTVEGLGGRRCTAFGSPPVCFLRGEVRRDGEGAPRLYECSFPRGL